jgi:hypothetical protein
MKHLVIALLVVCALALTVGAQKNMKPWTEWNEKEAKKILDNSAWGQTQAETDISEMFYSPNSSSAPTSSSRNARGATNQAVPTYFHIRFLTAKPIRQAFKITVEAQQKTPNKQLSDRLQAFVDQKIGDQIVIGVTYDSQDQRYSGDAMQAFNSAVTAVLKNVTYLEVKGGKRVFLESYQAPGNDGMGAKFTFKRMVDGKPFITPEINEVRFYSEIQKLKLNMRFKVAEMMYDGQLEY